jgi:hypothetical protein
VRVHRLNLKIETRARGKRISTLCGTGGVPGLTPTSQRDGGTEKINRIPSATSRNIPMPSLSSALKGNSVITVTNPFISNDSANGSFPMIQVLSSCFACSSADELMFILLVEKYGFEAAIQRYGWHNLRLRRGFINKLRRLPERTLARNAATWKKIARLVSRSKRPAIPLRYACSLPAGTFN